jgi:apoptosis-inducing factor 2
VRDRAVAVAGQHVLLGSGESLEPDHLVLATGSSYPFPAKLQEPSSSAAKARVLAAHEALKQAERVLIVGAGPSGLELAGEIKAFFPAKQVIVADQAEEILAGPFADELRAALRRQLADLGVELVLGASFPLPDAEPATHAYVRAGELEADIWFRAFGVKPATGFLPPEWLDRDGYVRVDEHLRVRDGVYAIGDIANANRNMAGMAGRQAELLAANLRARITGEGSEQPYMPLAPMIAIPLGPEGGAGQMPDGLLGPDMVADLKGRDMLVERNAALFDASPQPLPEASVA